LKVRGRATPAAVEVRSRLESGTGWFLVYFDIDVIDFVEFPAADALQPNQGLTFPDAFAALQIFCASLKFGGLIVTEFNPDHDDKEGTLAKQLIESLAQALQS
jgi:arginase